MGLMDRIKKVTGANDTYDDTYDDDYYGVYGDNYEGAQDDSDMQFAPQPQTQPVGGMNMNPGPQPAVNMGMNPGAGMNVNPGPQPMGGGISLSGAMPRRKKRIRLAAAAAVTPTAQTSFLPILRAMPGSRNIITSIGE